MDHTEEERMDAESFVRLHDQKAGQPCEEGVQVYLDITNRCTKRVPKRRPTSAEVSICIHVYLPRISLPACDCCVHIHAGTCTVGKFPRSSCQSCIIITAVHICSSISYWVVTVHHCVWFSHLVHYYSYRHAIVRTFGLPAEY